MKKLLRMALFAALPLAAMMMFSSYYGGPGNNPCPPPGSDYYTVLVPVPGDCSSFYACSDGVPVLQHCPDGLHFNDELDTCEVPTDEEDCAGSSGGGSQQRVSQTHPISTGRTCPKCGEALTATRTIINCSAGSNYCTPGDFTTDNPHWCK